MPRRAGWGKTPTLEAFRAPAQRVFQALASCLDLECEKTVTDALILLPQLRGHKYPLVGRSRVLSLWDRTNSQTS